jgi:hypothetical protein
MATDNNMLGLRAHIAGKNTAPESITQTKADAANLSALGMDADIITMLNVDKWQALVIRGSDGMYRPPEWVDSKEAALENLLELLSTEAHRMFKIRSGETVSCPQS